MGRFYSDLGADVGRVNYAPASSDGNYPPRVFFEVDHEASGLVMTASPPGCSIECLYVDDRSFRVIVYDVREHPAEPSIIAHVTVHVPDGEDHTQEAIAIASALYWSWWRACDMRGEAPADGYERRELAKR